MNKTDDIFDKLDEILSDISTLYEKIAALERKTLHMHACHKCKTPIDSRQTHFVEGGQIYLFCDRCFEQVESYDLPERVKQFMEDKRPFEQSLIERARERRERGESKWVNCKNDPNWVECQK